MTSQRSHVVLRVGAAVLLATACGMGSETEQELGAAMAAKVERELPVSRDAALDAWLDTLGARLVAVADTSERHWEFTVIDSDELNAFAIPGGHVYVYRGLLDAAASMSEVAGVLGHEVAHVTLRHSAEQFKQRTRTNIIVGLFCSVTGFCGGNVARLALEVGGAALFARHSREDEAQSDSAAVVFLVRAGIDPAGVPAMFSRLAAAREAQPGRFEAFFASHPLDGERVAATRAMVGALPPSEHPWQADDSTYRRLLKKP